MLPFSLYERASDEHSLRSDGGCCDGGWRLHDGVRVCWLTLWTNEEKQTQQVESGGKEKCFFEPKPIFIWPPHCRPTPPRSQLFSPNPALQHHHRLSILRFYAVFSLYGSGLVVGNFTFLGFLMIMFRGGRADGWMETRTQPEYRNLLSRDV